jgi:glycosyltransferase involved in cell wall biosynthesis
MRITIVQGAFLPVPPIRGGAVEKMWFQLGQQFAELGHTVVHVSRSFQGLPDRETIEQVKHLRVSGYDLTRNSLLLKLRDLVYSLRVMSALPNADIIVTNSFWIPVLLRRKSTRCGRIIASVERMPKGQMWLYRHVSALRCCSEAVRLAVLAEQPILAPKAVLIPNLLSFDLRPIFTVPAKLPVILFVGRIHPEKGVDLLLLAFLRACELGLTGWSLRVVGPYHVSHGGGGESWVRHLRQLGGSASDKIHWIGPVFDESSLIEEYSNASIFVYPSLADRGEAFGVAPLEAMAHGAVPVVSSLNCFKDFILDGLNGLVFEHRTADPISTLAHLLVHLATDPVRLQSLASKAMKVRQSHHPRVIAHQMIDLFESLLVD